MSKIRNLRTYQLLIICVLFVIASSCKKNDNNNTSVTYGTMTDQDGNVYKTVIIGTQTWMAENLRTTTYNDGSKITNISIDDEWSDLISGAFCNFNNTTSEDSIVTFGRLYNWYAVNTGKLAPKGWHIPTDAEWSTLTDYLGGESVSGGKLKETDTTHWSSPNTGATNETGFTALPGGYRHNYGPFGSVACGYFGFWWSATEYDSFEAIYRHLHFHYSSINRMFSPKESGFSVRCVKD